MVALLYYSWSSGEVGLISLAAGQFGLKYIFDDVLLV